MVKVGFFSSSKDLMKDKYYDDIMLLLEILKTNKNITKVIYGGGNTGIMGMIHNVFSDMIVSHNLEKWKVYDDENIYPNIMERQKALLLDADLFIVLPGGVGTISEMFDCIMMNDTGNWEKPVILYNCCNYWTNIYNVIKEIQDIGASKPQKLLYMSDNPKEIMELIV
jgi:uncharacterized protein (TIGR00730 family)